MVLLWLYGHGGEPTSHHVILMIGIFLEILCDSGKTLFDISVNTGQICMKFEADTPQKWLKYAHLTKFSDKKLI